MSAPASNFRLRVEAHLGALYPERDAEALARELLAAMRLDESTPTPEQFRNYWDPSDVWVISYGDSVVEDGQPGLRSLRGFLNEHLAPEITGVHVLPFFPYTSDDGFAVSDYLSVREDLGDWGDLRALAQERRLMSDLVINHCSAEHLWFRNYCAGEAPGRDYFVEMDPGADLRAVVRPRTSALLRPTETRDGLRYVWCTFSHDQIDLNFANPAVLLEFVRIIRHYLDQGVRVFRFDAVAFLWKQEGSSSLNLPQTHEVVRLLRCLIEHEDPSALIITETNIPNRENLSYFGNGNEAHLVYNFSLPPLLLFSLVSGRCGALKRWMMSMPPARNGTTYLNFLASHDGIGLRPAEGLLDEQEIDALIALAERSGGQVSWRALDNGQRRPYEINIALYDALQGHLDGPDAYGFERFVCAHAIMLALEGIPAFYIHSLIGTRNDHALVAMTGHARSINRHRWERPALESVLSDPANTHGRVLAALKSLIRIRAQQPAFHPNATQFTLHLGEQIFAFWRQSMDRRQSIFVLNNISREPQSVSLTELNLIVTDSWYDLIGGRVYEGIEEKIELAPYQTVWITNRTT